MRLDGAGSHPIAVGHGGFVHPERDRLTVALHCRPTVTRDFESVHRCGVLAAESRAAQNGYDDIESAAVHLHGMLEALSIR